MAVRTRRISLTRLVAAATFHTLYTVPADRTLIVRSVWLQNQGANAGTAILRVVNSDTGTVLRFLSAVALAPHQDLYYERWVVLEENDVIEASFTQVNSLNVWISGSLLAGDPS